MNSPGITLRELAFVRDVLIPRAWVQGAEVDELLRLRVKIDGIFSALREEPTAPANEPTATEPEQAARAPGRTKKPRHPKKQRGQPPLAPDGS